MRACEGGTGRRGGGEEEAGGLRREGLREGAREAGRAEAGA